MRRRVATLALVLALVLSAAGTAAAVATGWFLRAPIGGDSVITLLLLGSDAGPLRGGNPLKARADAIHLLFVSPDRDRATFVNIPRDSYVSVPGMGRRKVNACLNGGAERCVAAMESTFGIDVDHWLLSDFNGLKTAVDRFGGISVDVPRTLTDGGADIAPGRQTLSGAQALTFARDRKHRPNGDFSRSEAQATLLQAAHRQLFSGGTPLRRITEMAGLVQQTTVTSLAADEVLRLAYLAMTMPPEAIANVTVPGNVGMAGAASVVFLPQQAVSIVRDAAGDGVVGAQG